jgi:DNA-binding beta-propeller fold protein YncE
MITLEKLTVGVALVLIPLLGACAGSDAGEAGVPTFQADPDWPQLPADFEWGQVIGIATDSRGHVWTSSRSQVAEWDAAGNLVQSWNASGPDGNWSTIHGLFIDHNDFVWTNARESDMTLKFTMDGQHVMTIGRFDETGGSNDPTLMGRPAEIWVDPVDNEVFVADGYGNRRVVVFDGETGEYLRHWGAYGERPDDDYQPDRMSGEPSRQFRTPHGIAGSRDGFIYVADRANNRIQVFRQNGEYVMENILRPLCAPEGQPAVPGCAGSAAFSVGFSPDDAQTYLYVADGGSHVIIVLRRADLERVDEFGGPGRGTGELGRPHNLAVDPQGNIFVAEAQGPWIFDAQGDSARAGFRAQKFTLMGAGAP